MHGALYINLAYSEKSEKFRATSDDGLKLDMSRALAQKSDKLRATSGDGL